MKKVFTFLFAIFSLIAANAQDIKILFNEVEYEDGATLTYDTQKKEFELFFDFRNTSRAEYTLVGHCQPVGETNIDIMSLCAGQCLAGTTSPAFVVPAESLYSSNGGSFDISFEVNGSTTAQSGTFLFSVCDNRTGDTLTRMTLEINYVPKQGISVVESALEMNAYPNPARESVKVMYQLSEGSDNASLVVFNLMGAAVKTVELNAHEGVAEMNVEDLPAGVYMYGIQSQGRLLSTKKLVVE